MAFIGFGETGRALAPRLSPHTFDLNSSRFTTATLAEALDNASAIISVVTPGQALAAAKAAARLLKLGALFLDMNSVAPGTQRDAAGGRYVDVAIMLKKPDLSCNLMKNVFFDTCVYHQPGINLLADVIDSKNILFGSEMAGAVRGIDPTTGHYFDDTKRYIDALPISEAERHMIFEGNARRGFSAAGYGSRGFVGRRMGTCRSAFAF